MELHLLNSSSISSHCSPRLTFQYQKSKLKVGIPNKSLISTGKKASGLLILCSNASEADTAVVVDKPPAMSRRFEVFSGHPTPFGATRRDDGVNFAVYSSNATSATLCFISLPDLPEKRVTEQIPFDPLTNRTGDVWHVFLKGDFQDMVYGYHFDGSFSPEDGMYFDSSQIVIDPYAEAVVSRGEYGALGPEEDCWPQMAGLVPFTNDEKLGINCIELMPCQEFNELEYYSYNFVLGDYKMNFWGYSTINFFSPMVRYSSAGIGNYGVGAVNEFKHLVREAHKRGIEVIMDVVFNHTAEGNENGPILSFRGVDNSVFYMVAPKGGFYNYSGCGNTFNCNHPVAHQFIVDCLS